MRKNKFFVLLVSMMAIYAPFASASAQIEVTLEGPELSIDQVAFVAKLSDENRMIFINLKNAQREAIIAAVKNGLSPDEAVQHMERSMNIEACAELELSN